MILQDWKKAHNAKVKLSNVKSLRTVYLILHAPQKLKSYGFSIMSNLKSWLYHSVLLSYYKNVVMPKPLRLLHDFITSTTAVAYRLHFQMNIPLKSLQRISQSFNKRIALFFAIENKWLIDEVYYVSKQ